MRAGIEPPFSVVVACCTYRLVRDEDDPSLDDLERKRLNTAQEAHLRRLRFERAEMSPDEAAEYLASDQGPLR